MKESNDLDKTIKVEVTNTNATVEKGFETIGKIFKRKKKREEPVESQENVACNSQKGLGWASLGGGLAGLSIMLGAFGAHSLKARLTEKKTRHLPYCHRLSRLSCTRTDLHRYSNLPAAWGYRAQAKPFSNLDKCRNYIFLRKSLRTGI